MMAKHTLPEAPPPEPPAQLPLSWQYVPGLAQPRVGLEWLPISDILWATWADVPPHVPLANVWMSLQQRTPQGVLLKGVAPAQVRQLQAIGPAFYVITGQEAILPLHRDLLAKRSLRELARRGHRHGRVAEVPIRPGLLPAFEAFRHNSAVGRKPQLRLLFRTEPLNAARLFVLQAHGGAWLAATSLTLNGPGRWYTELILRHRRAPVGVLEALFADVHNCLANEGAHTLSLGEVPFYGHTAGWRSKLLARAGRSIRFAYNAQKLHAFKNKFQPEWQPLTMVASRPISLLMLAEMCFHTRVHRLVWHSLARAASRSLKPKV